MKYLLLPVLFVLSFSLLQAQWVEGNRKQSQDVKGNGALIVYEGNMYLWNEENHFQISTDNGATWSDPPDSIGGANPHVTRMTAAGGRIYAALNFGTGNGIPIYSSDMGVTWQPDTVGAPGHALGWGGHPAVSGIFAWGHWVLVGWDQPVPFSIKTFDGTWTPNDYMNTGANRPSSFAAKGDTLFCAGAKIYYTTDGGETFTVPANNGYSGYGAQLFLDGNRLYMFAFKAWGQLCYLYYSDDNAENWTEVDVTSLTSRKVVNGDPYYPTTFFIKGNRIEFTTVMEAFNTPPNVWKSTDLGTTWERDTAGLPSKYVNGISSFAYTPDGTLWAVRDHENIYRQKIDEGTGGGKLVTVAPTLMSPQQGGQLPLPALFVWGSIPNATSYQLQIAIDTAFASIIAQHHDRTPLYAKPSFTSIILDRSGITDTSLTVTSLEHAMAYYWRVRGIGEGDQAGPWSDAASFTTATSGVAEEFNQRLSIGPNPCHERLTVRFPEGEYTSLEFRDLLGTVVRSHYDIGNRTSYEIDVRGIAPGSYWLVLKGAGGEISISAIIVK
jgi:hypothetical protein